MKQCAGVNTYKSTSFFALDWSLWMVRDLSCYPVHDLVILSRPDPLCSTELATHRPPECDLSSALSNYETRSLFRTQHRSPLSLRAAAITDRHRAAVNVTAMGASLCTAQHASPQP